ncbi:MAG: septation protein SepH, partial [Actinomycetota bacterium]
AVVRPPRAEPAPRRSRPEIPARSKLSPAEIQGLIRAGRGVRSVANLAGTPVAWVKYLAEPIQQERVGIVGQMLLVRQERARLGPSSAPIGQSILENLRGRGVRSPEAILDQGFSAHRPDGREWRVRLAFDHRGNRYVANWSFDPQTREVTPLNTMATQLGWRRQPGQDDEEPKTRTRRRSSSSAKRSGRRTSTRKRSTTKKSSTRRTAAARKSKRTTTRSATRKTTSRSGRR